MTSATHEADFATELAGIDGIYLALQPTGHWEVVYVAMDVTNNRRCHLQFVVPRFIRIGVNARVRAHWSTGARR
jgi:hypothetical protein